MRRRHQTGLVFSTIAPPFYEYTILFNASYNGYDSIDVRRKPDGRNEARSMGHGKHGRSVSVALETWAELTMTWL